MVHKNWDNMRMFLAVARAGSVRGAAKQIGTTHATVSRRVQALEVELGSPVLERLRQGQCLTELGQRIMPWAIQAEENFSTIDRMAFSADTGLAGKVRLSLSETLYLSLLDKPIYLFMQRYPMIDVELIASDNMSSLSQREADVVIRITNAPPDAAYGRKIANSPLMAYASNEYLNNRPKRDQWISLDYPPAKKPIIPARVVARANSASLAARLIRLGRGIGLLPCYMGDTDPFLHRVPEVALIPDLQVWVLTHGDVRTNPRVRVLMEHLYQALKDLKPLIEGTG